MRKLSILLVTGLLLGGFAAPASSATLTATGVLGVSLGALPPISIAGGPVNIFVSSGTGAFTLPAGVFASTVALPGQLFTGVSLISTLTVTATNQTITQAGGVGTGLVTGFAKVGVLGGLVNLLIPLNVGGTNTVTSVVAALAITVQNNAGWTTGVASMTLPSTPNGATTTYVTTAQGSDSRTAGHNGSITLVNPTKVITNAAGILPLFTTITLNFTGGGVPEPGTLLLIGSGVVGLAVLGRRRMRK